MDDRQPNLINQYLMPDEYVLWNGRPGKGNLLTRHDVYMIPFSILWCGFAILWEALVFAGSAPLTFKIWGIPFICVGLYMVFGRFLMKLYLREKTVYVITNRRVFIFCRNQVNTIDYYICPAKTVTRHAGGYGTISFSSSTQPNQMFFPQGQRQNQNVFELDNIPEVDRVMQILSGQI